MCRTRRCSAGPSTSWASSTAGRRWSCTDGPWPAPFDTDLEARQGLAYQLVEGIALLSKVDWQAKGLEDLGRPDGFHERQVDRWTAFLERIKGRELPGFDEAAAWLRAHKPIDYIPGLMHGDYQFANVMFEHGAPARLAAIVDWEMGTVGDPKLDLGLGRAELARGHRPPRRRPGRATSTCTACRRVTQVLGHYAEVSGRQVDDIDYYFVLAKWKLAVVLEQGFQRAGDDRSCRPSAPIVLDLMRGAAELAETTDYVVTGLTRARPHGSAASYGAAGGRSGSRTSRRRRPPRGQVRVRVDAAAVNFPDVLIVADEYQISVPTAVRPGERARRRGRRGRRRGRRFRRRRPGDRRRRSSARSPRRPSSVPQRAASDPRRG